VEVEDDVLGDVVDDGFEVLVELEDEVVVVLVLDDVLEEEDVDVVVVVGFVVLVELEEEVLLVDVLVDVVELLEVVVVGPFGMHVQGAKSVVPPHV